MRDDLEGGGEHWEGRGDARCAWEPKERERV